MNKKEQVIQLCKDLRLPSIRKMVQEETEFTNSTQAFDILFQVFVQEKNDRFVRAKQNRIRAANFPQKKLLEELLLDFEIKTLVPISISYTLLLLQCSAKTIPSNP